jgi:predicted nucleotidyltransferase
MVYLEEKVAYEESMIELAIDLPERKIAAFCRKWQIKELALFGSVLSSDFRPDSDVDVLVTFKPDAHWTLFDHVTMQDELQEIFGRDVDLISRLGIEHSHNHIRRQAILDSARVIYAAS